MSIRLKLLAACLAFALITAVLGLLGNVQQNKMADLALEIYDSAFTGIDYAHQAHTAFLRFANTHTDPALTELDDASRAAIGKIIDRVDVTTERASTPRAKELAGIVRTKLVTLQSSKEAVAPLLKDLDTAFDKLVKRYASDGFVFRARADDLVDDAKKTMAISLGVALILALIVAVTLERSIAPAIKRAAIIADAIALGRFDNIIRAGGRGETARLLTALNRMQTALLTNIERINEHAAQAEKTAEQERNRKIALETLARDFNTAVSGQLRSLAAAATELEATASGLSEHADRNNIVTSDAKRSTHIAIENANTVASATEELLAASNGITDQIANTANITEEAVQASHKAMGLMKELAEVVGGVSHVANFINDIAAQTNLLALNATIEAARAGDAGKGFAVVASEVKSLANQTARATEDIAARITAVQNSASQVGDMIKSVSSVISRISENSQAIAAAVSEQSAATGEISRSVHEATGHIEGVGRNIATVVETTEFTASASVQLLGAASELARESEKLRQEVEGFLDSMARTSDRRSGPRVTVEKSIVVEFPRQKRGQGSGKMQARLVNLSVGGAAIHLDAAAEIGDEIALEGIALMPVSGRIVEKSGILIRVQFMLDDETQGQIEQAITRLAA